MMVRFCFVFFCDDNVWCANAHYIDQYVCNGNHVWYLNSITLWIMYAECVIVCMCMCCMCKLVCVCVYECLCLCMSFCVCV